MILLAFFFPWLLLGWGLPKSKWKCKWIHSKIESLNLQCFEKLTEQSAVQICSNNLLLEIATFVSIAESQTFDALVSKACNFEWQGARQIGVIQNSQDKKADNEEKEEYMWLPLPKYTKSLTWAKKRKDQNGSRSNKGKRSNTPSTIMMSDKCSPSSSQLGSSSFLSLKDMLKWTTTWLQLFSVPSYSQSSDKGLLCPQGYDWPRQSSKLLE